MNLVGTFGGPHPSLLGMAARQRQHGELSLIVASPDAHRPPGDHGCPPMAGQWDVAPHQPVCGAFLRTPSTSDGADVHRSALVAAASPTSVSGPAQPVRNERVSVLGCDWI